jgi:hypothetical protein
MEHKFAPVQPKKRFTTMMIDDDDDDGIRRMGSPVDMGILEWARFQVRSKDGATTMTTFPVPFPRL